MRTLHTWSFASIAAAAGLLLSACASTGYHYSELVGERYYKTPIDTYPLIISKVDGKSTMRGPVRVDPGQRSITFQGPPGGTGARGAEELTVTMDIKPCTRYYIVAQKDNRLDVDFKPKVDYEEPVAGCTPPSK